MFYNNVSSIYGNEDKVDEINFNYYLPRESSPSIFYEMPP